MLDGINSSKDNAPINCTLNNVILDRSMMFKLSTIWELNRSELVAISLSVLFLCVAIALSIFDQRVAGYVVGVLGISITVAIWTIVQDIRKRLDSVFPYFKIKNPTFQVIANIKFNELRNIIRDLEGNTVNLKISDLFTISKNQLLSSKKVIAVDVKGENLLISDQINNYLETARKASANRTLIYRVIVFPDRYNCLRKEVRDGEIKSPDALQAAKVIQKYNDCGSKKLHLLFQEDLSDPKSAVDFAVFDDKLVLHDPSTFVGQPTDIGYVSVEESKVEDYIARYNLLAEQAQKNSDLVEKIRSTDLSEAERSIHG
jgi:hypothetical protein